MEEESNEIPGSIFEEISSGDAFAKLVGTKLLEVKPGFARAALEITENVVNVHEIAHGGVIFTLADLACEAAGNSLGEVGIAVQTNIHFLVAAKCGDLLTATAKVTGRIESFGVIDFQVKNDAGRLLSTGQQIIILKRKK